jgi:hypothetical protein
VHNSNFLPVLTTPHTHTHSSLLSLTRILINSYLCIPGMLKSVQREKQGDLQILSAYLMSGSGPLTSLQKASPIGLVN